ncbi:MAG: phosphatase PAP2 family protein [Polymorphobacter sp.]
MRAIFIGLLTAGLTTVATAQAPAAAPVVTAPPTSAMAAAPRKAGPGYLTGKPPVEILKLLPPPPAPGSAQDMADRSVYAATAKDVGGTAWQEAVSELNPTSPAYFAKLSCAVGKMISPQTTPITMAMIARAGGDMTGPMSTAKNFYKRPRPFTTDKGPACDPISKDGIGAGLGFAYPSGHSGIGWLWGLMLADANPARAEQIRAFGQHTGDLRIACRVHWLSDVAYGRILATSVYGRLLAEPEFQADLVRAADEIAKAPVAECKG